VKNDSTLTAIQLRGYSGMGPTERTGRDWRHRLYQCPNIETVVYPVYTNKTVSGNFRGPEFPQGYFGIQSMMDDVAFRMDMDPVDFILKNMTRKFRDETPYTVYTLDECIHRGIETFDWKQKWHPPGSDAGPIKRGSGVAFLAFRAGLGRSNAVISPRRVRQVHVHVGVTDVGAGAKTTMALIAAEALGVPLSKIEVVLGRHRSPPVLGRRIGQPDDDHDRRRGGRGGARSQDHNSPRRGAPTGAQAARSLPPARTRSSKVQCATRSARTSSEVEVDDARRVRVVKYLAVHDCGRVINPLTAMSQIKGGALMGIGMALHEDLVYDPRSGVALNAGYYGDRVLTHRDAPGDRRHLHRVRLTATDRSARRAYGRGEQDPGGRGDRERDLQRDRPADERSADHARQDRHGCRDSGFGIWDSMRAFTNVNPRDLRTAVTTVQQARAAGRTATMVGGGSDVLGMMKERLITPDVLVNLKAIKGLDEVKAANGGLTIGGLTTLAAISTHPAIRRHYAVLAEAAADVATPQIRNVATLAGNVCQRPWCWYYRNGFTCFKNGGNTCYSVAGENQFHAIFGGGPSYIVHPSDTAPALVALNATFRIVSPAGERVVLAAEFFTLPRVDAAHENILKDDEALASVTLPAPPPGGMRSTYHKVMDREAWTHALVSAAVVLQTNGETCSGAAIVLGGVAPVPWRVPGAEALLVGKRITAELAARAGEAAVAGARPLAKNAYKVPLAQAVVRRALEQLAQAG
jgi:xanthine dehydrogenase YagS FAD-binding subunit